MTKAIDDTLAQIRAQIETLEAEIQSLRTAESVLVFMVEQQGKKPARRVALTGITLYMAIRKTLAKIGPAKTSQIVRHVRTRWRPGAKSTSIRSLLSIGKAKGKFVRKDGLWNLKREKPNTAKDEP